MTWLDRCSEVFEALGGGSEPVEFDGPDWWFREPAVMVTDLRIARVRALTNSDLALGVGRASPGPETGTG